MKLSDVQQLDHGLYRVYWKSGGSSLASVGSDDSGKRWLAPTNWILSDTKLITDYQKVWRHVEKMELIMTGK